ncbi:MAG: hypothetical protein LBH46_01050 [Rickettsiales bacterium]|nr:hypothetical protein [Rickettsiales bacterium]
MKKQSQKCKTINKISNEQEIIIKNTNDKKTKVSSQNIEIVNDTIKEYAYANFKSSCLKVDYFGKLGCDFRVIACIGDEDKIFSLDLQSFDEKKDFGVFDISLETGYICKLLKFNEEEILQKILEYISYERFEGGYFTKGKFFGNSADDLVFVGVCGDIKNEKYILDIDLEKTLESLPKLSIKNDFFICKIL